jgi:sec-independent protein translocase protein TatA
VFQIGPLELIVVLVVALLVLGPQRLPEVARSIGRGMREFRTALDRAGDDEDEPVRIDDAGDAPADAEAANAEDEPADDDAPASADPDVPAPTADDAYQKDADSSEPSSSSRDLV